MRATHPRTSALSDPDLDVFSDLVAPELPGPLEVAVSAAGGTLRASRVRSVTWWPGSSVAVNYDTRIDGGGLGPSPELVAVAGPISDGSFLVEAGNDRVGVWALPHDPVLPGLPAALDPDRAAAVIRELGGGDQEARTRLRAYRAGKRAVVAVETASSSIYFKLTRPTAIGSLHDRHRSLPASLPVPHSLGVDRRLGILALQAMPGRTLHHVLEDADGGALPPAGEVVRMAGSLPAPTSKRTTASPLTRAHELAGLLRLVVPECAGLLDAVLDGIGAEDVAPTVPSHGDWYESQILVDDGHISGLLDVDTYGWGRPGDDAATMLGHLAVWATMSRVPGRIRTYAGELLGHWDAILDPADLRRRTAATILGLATGPFRIQQRDWPEATAQRIQLAERWLLSARRVGEKHLIGATGSSHGHPSS